MGSIFDPTQTMDEPGPCPTLKSMIMIYRSSLCRRWIFRCAENHSDPTDIL